MESFLSQPPGGKENIIKSEWESQLDTSVLEQSRQKILHILNTGSFKELKGLQQIGDKKAKLILGWREIHGHFTKVGREKVDLVSSCNSPQKPLFHNVCDFIFWW